MATEITRPDVAVFIDFENVYVSVRDKLDVNPNFEVMMDRLADFGRVVIARAYADWYRYPRVTSALYANRIEPMYVPTHVYDRDVGRVGRAIKNSADMNLAVDVMKTLFTYPTITKYVLATGDRDFIPLVHSIRQQGKEVIIIGVGGAASAHLAQSADEFIFYEQLLGKKPSALNQDQPRARMPEKSERARDSEDEGSDLRDQPRERFSRESRYPRRDADRERPADRPADRPVEPIAPPQPAPQPEPIIVEPQADAEPQGPDIYETLVRAVHLARERGYVCSFGSLKLLMKELMGGDFRESKYKDAQGRAFVKFKDFAIEAERRGKVQVFTSGAVNEVFLPGEDPYKLSQFAQDLKEDPAPAAAVAAATDPRNSSGGRRRRRRRNGPRDRINGVDELLNGELEGDEGDDEALLDAAVAEALALLTGQDLPPDSVFDDLLEQAVLDSADDRAALLNDPMLVIDAPIESPVDFYAESSSDSVDAPAAAASVPFSDDELTWVVATVARSAKPLSFIQIHDQLRIQRAAQGVSRSNEELRTLVKQVINSGMIERVGKGSRAAYRLPDPSVEGEGTAGDQLDAPAETSQLPQAQQTAHAAGHGIAPEVLSAVAEMMAGLPAASAAPESAASSAGMESSAAEPATPATSRRRGGRRKSEPAAEMVAIAPAAIDSLAPDQTAAIVAAAESVADAPSTPNQAAAVEAAVADVQTEAAAPVNPVADAAMADASGTEPPADDQTALVEGATPEQAAPAKRSRRRKKTEDAV